MNVIGLVLKLSKFVWICLHMETVVSNAFKVRWGSKTVSPLPPFQPTDSLS